jgi:hypothetical protein
MQYDSPISSFFVSENILFRVRFQVLTAASMKMITLWDTAPRSLAGVDRRFRGAYRLHHDDVGSTHGTVSQKAIILILFRFPINT